MELADRGVARAAHLPVGRGVLRPYRLRRLPVGLGEHRVAPLPEVATLGAPAQAALERVRVGVDEAREDEALGHSGILAFPGQMPRGTILA